MKLGDIVERARTGAPKWSPRRDRRSRTAKTFDLSAELATALTDIRTGRFEQALAALAAAGALVTTAEIFTSHDSASFGNKMMWLPIVIVPTIAPAGIAAVFSKRAAKTVLPLASALVVLNGLQGTYLHARGILQKPGGASNLRYNIEMGPPAFAPLLATMVGGMGLLAAALRRSGES